MARGPARISSIIGERVELADLEESHVSALRAHGLVPERGSFGARTLLLPPEATAVLEQPEGQRVMSALAQSGLAFLRDPRQGWSPADLMEELVERGGYSGPFRVCAFDGERWLIDEIPPR